MAVQLSPSQRQALLATLHEFERTPGRFSLSLREPRLLFDEAHAVLWLAAGRSVDELGLAAEEEASARRAARFFVRTALLRQGSDHYTLLGLTQAASSEQVREHYRLMIRLTHPDFEAGGEHWPSDAASRINIANDVLSSAVRRREYDESLQPATPPVASQATKASPVPAQAVPKPTAASARRKAPRAGGRWSGGLSTRTKAVLAGLGALLSAGALWLLNGTDSGSLTARQRSINEDTASYVESGLGFGLGLRPAPSSAAAAAQPVARSEGVALARPTATQPAAAAPVAPAAAAPVIAAPVRMATAEADTAAGVSLQIARQLTAVRAEPVVATAAEVLPSSAPTLAPAAIAPATVVAVAAQRLTMQQVHPLMSNVLASLPSGRGETLAQWIAPEWRSRPSNQAFVSQFNQWLAGQRVKEVNKIALSSQPQGDNLIVDGVVQVTTLQTAAGEQARSLRLRALFQPQDGQAVLTQLTASEPQ